MQQQERIFKPNTGSSAEVTSKHVKEKMEHTKNKREQRMEKRRKDPSVECKDIVKLIQTFPIDQFLHEKEPIAICEKLLEVLKTKDIEPFFGPSDMFDQVAGQPFLFANKNVINKLLSLLAPNHKFLLQTVSHILIIISAHPETLTWTTPLMKGLPLMLQLINSHEDTIVRENIIWTLAHMCIDNSQMNRHIYPKVIAAIEKNLVYALEKQQWNIISICVFFIKSMLHHKQESPNVSDIMSLWNILINKLFLNEYFTEEDIDKTYEMTMCTIANAAKVSDEFRIHICKNGTLMDRIINPKKHSSNLYLTHADILTSLLLTQETHLPLIQMGILKLFKSFLFDKQPIIREEGAGGLVIISTCFAAIPFLTEESFLNVIEKILTRNDIRKVVIPIKFLFCNLLIYKEALPKMRHMLKYLDTILYEKYDNDLLLICLKGILNFCKHNDEKVMQNALEEFDGITQIEKISLTHSDQEISSLAIKILNTFNQEMDLSE